MNDQPQITTSMPGDMKDTAYMQAFNNRRKFAKGYEFATNVGINTFENIQFPGTARMLLGLALQDTSGDPRNRFTLNLNNENIIQGISWAELTKTNVARAAGLVTGSSFNGEFYVYIRALSGSDSITISYTAVTGGFLLPTFFFKTLMSSKEI